MDNNNQEKQELDLLSLLGNGLKAIGNGIAFFF